MGPRFILGPSINLGPLFLIENYNKKECKFTVFFKIIDEKLIICSKDDDDIFCFSNGPMYFNKYIQNGIFNNKLFNIPHIF